MNSCDLSNFVIVSSDHVDRLLLFLFGSNHDVWSTNFEIMIIIFFPKSIRVGDSNKMKGIAILEALRIYSRELRLLKVIRPIMQFSKF